MSAGCVYCGAADAPQRDHVLPRSRGGTDAPENVVPACGTCNASKGDLLPLEWVCVQHGVLSGNWRNGLRSTFAVGAVTSASYRFTDEARRILAALAAKLGVSQSAVIEIALRQLAKKEGVK